MGGWDVELDGEQKYSQHFIFLFLPKIILASIVIQIPFITVFGK
jgi:hypothetical protein